MEYFEEQSKKTLLEKGYKKLVTEIKISFIFCMLSCVSACIRQATQSSVLRYICLLTMILSGIIISVIMIADFIKGDVYSIFNFYYDKNDKSKNENWIAFSSFQFVKVIICASIFVFAKYFIQIRLYRELKSYILAENKYSDTKRSKKPEILFVIELTLVIILSLAVPFITIWRFL